MVDTVGLGTFLYERRISKSYSQKYVADITNISVRMIRYIEYGISIPNLDLFWIICDLYDSPPLLPKSPRSLTQWGVVRLLSVGLVWKEGALRITIVL